MKNSTSLSRFRATISRAARYLYAPVLMFLAFVPGQLQAGDHHGRTDSAKCDKQENVAFFTLCNTLYPFSSSDLWQIYCQTVANGGNVYNPSTLCTPPLPFTNLDLWQIYCAIKADSGTGGNLSGTLTPPHIPYATAIHTLSDGPLTVSGSNIVLPAFLLGHTGSGANYFTLQSGVFTGFGNCQLSLVPSSSSFLLQSSVENYIQFNKTLGAYITDSLPITLHSDSVNIPLTGGTDGQALTRINSKGGTQWKDVGNVSGSGINGYHAKWTGLHTLDTSVIYETQTGQVGINTILPNAALSVQVPALNNDGIEVLDNTGVFRSALLISASNAGALELKDGANAFKGLITANGFSFVNSIGFGFGTAVQSDYVTIMPVSSNDGLDILDPGGNFRVALEENASDAGSLIMRNASNTRTYQLDGGGFGFINTGFNFGFGTSLPDASAALDCESTTQGFLAPQMTTTQILAIASPKEGLIVYNLTTHRFNYWDGTQWNFIAGVPGN